MALIERDRKLMAQSSYIACSSRYILGHRRGKERKSAKKATRPSRRVQGRETVIGAPQSGAGGANKQGNAIYAPQSGIGRA